MLPAIPIATYRLQLSVDFDFDAAASVVPYLKALGITHLYASPFMRARKGSTHGYDVTDHAQFNPELGGEAGFERLSAALRHHDLGLILDFVPNHVGVHFSDNPWWLDVLEWGPASPHAASFDIDWELLPYRARGGVLLPIIGSSYGQALENGEIELRYDASQGSFSAWYFEHRLPIAPERYGEILGWKPIAPGQIAPRRRFRCTTCSNASTTSSATGGLLPATSTTADFSTSTRWRACASRTPAHSRRSIGW
jgi:(1->4)-alpha-D-glucan 1-alpha-D-glucosylmutase